MSLKKSSLLLSLFVFGSASHQVFAQILDPQAVGDANVGISTVNAADNSSSVDLKAYSNQTKPVPVPAGPNAVATDTGVPAPGAAGALPGSTIKVGGNTYGPAVGVLGAPKAAGQRQVHSVTGVSIGDAKYTPIGGGGGQLRAFGLVPPGVTGEGAGEAKDPINVKVGSYAYVIHINEITLTTGLNSDFAGVSMDASDSLFTTPLWSLDVLANGLLNSKSDLQITFVSNSTLSLNDSLVASTLRNAFTVSGGTATLTSYDLFNSTLTLAQLSSYSQSTRAGANGVGADVPEPSAFVMASSGVFGLFVFARGRRRRRG